MRQVKALKSYLGDTGFLHAPLGVEDLEALSAHPKVGASWGGFAIEQILAFAETRDAHFWATYAGAELELFLFARGKRLGYEIKYEEAPRVTKSMRVAIGDLHLDSLQIVYPGSSSYPLDEKIRALSLSDLDSALRPPVTGEAHVSASAPRLNGVLEVPGSNPGAPTRVMTNCESLGQTGDRNSRASSPGSLSDLEHVAGPHIASLADRRSSSRRGSPGCPRRRRSPC